MRAALFCVALLGADVAMAVPVSRSPTSAGGSIHGPSAIAGCLEQRHLQIRQGSSSAESIGMYLDCGNAAACPAGYHCRSSEPMSGLREMCEPDECLVAATVKSSSARDACTAGMMKNASLICRSEGTATLGALQDSSVSDLCDTLRTVLPSGCTVSSDCFHFNCSEELLGATVVLTAELDACATPAELGLTFDTIPSITGPLNYCATSQTELKAPIPFLTFSVPGLPISAGAEAVAKLGGSLGAVSIEIGVDACTVLPVVGQQCGSKLTSALPFYFLGPWQFNFSDACASTKPQNPSACVEPPPPPPPAPPAFCKSCTCPDGCKSSGSFSNDQWCDGPWRDGVSAPFLTALNVSTPPQHCDGKLYLDKASCMHACWSRNFGYPVCKGPFAPPGPPEWSKPDYNACGAPPPPKCGMPHSESAGCKCCSTACNYGGGSECGAGDSSCHGSGDPLQLACCASGNSNYQSCDFFCDPSGDCGKPHPPPPPLPPPPPPAPPPAPPAPAPSPTPPAANWPGTYSVAGVSDAHFNGNYQRMIMPPGSTCNSKPVYVLESENGDPGSARLLFQPTGSSYWLISSRRSDVVDGACKNMGNIGVFESCKTPDATSCSHKWQYNTPKWHTEPGITVTSDNSPGKVQWYSGAGSGWKAGDHSPTGRAASCSMYDVCTPEYAFDGVTTGSSAELFGKSFDMDGPNYHDAPWVFTVDVGEPHTFTHWRVAGSSWYCFGAAYLNYWDDTSRKMIRIPQSDVHFKPNGPTKPTTVGPFVTANFSASVTSSKWQVVLEDHTNPDNQARFQIYLSEVQFGLETTP